MDDARTLEFEVVGVAEAGAIRILRIPAADADLATQLAQREGLRVLSCKPRSAGFFGAGKTSKPNTVRLDIALFAHELGALLDAFFHQPENALFRALRDDGPEISAFFPSLH